MKIKFFAFFIFSIFLISVFNSVLADDEFKEYGNEIFYSPDKKTVLISINDNTSLAMYNVYEFYVFNSNGLNLSIRYNTTEIAIKFPNENALIGEFFINDTEFDILVVDASNNNTLIKVHYIAEKGYIPIHRKDKVPIDRWKRTQQNKIINLPDIPMNDGIKIFLSIIILTSALLTIFGVLIKTNKENNTVEGEFIQRRDFYKMSQEISAETKTNK